VIHADLNPPAASRPGLKCPDVPVGTLQTPGGVKRNFVTIGANNSGESRSPQLRANWDYYPGVLNW
jgi:hypothetical protein